MKGAGLGLGAGAERVRGQTWVSWGRASAELAQWGVLGS